MSFKCKEIENIWVEIKVKNNNNLSFCCAYRHPDSDNDIFTAHFKSLLPKLINKRVFIMGDFNINLLNYDSHIPTNDFTNTLFTNNFLPCKHNPTRVSNHSATIIDNIFTSKTVGPHSIPIDLLKILGPHISEALAKLVNQSFLEGIFPSKLKLAKVISLYKKDDPEIASNYRPISLLPLFSKLYERLMYRTLHSFLIYHKIIYPLQFGFQENHSVEHTLISMTEVVRSTLEKKKYSCGIFLDLQKAFEHNILFPKSECFGIRGNALRWFDSYLSDRTQYVSNNGTNSDCMNVTCGVPQGSVPLFFLIFINDLPNVSRKLKFHLFADDTNIYYDTETLDKLVKTVNIELKFIKRWLDANKLSLNIDKTNYVIFHSTSSSISPDTVIEIGKKYITRVKYLKFLGLLLDENLSWKYHLGELSNNLARTCDILFRIRNLLTSESLICIYNALFMSFLQYCITVWGQTYDSYLEPIFKLQKKAVIAISPQPYRSLSLPIFKKLKLLRLQDIFQLRLLTFVYESINKKNPSCFHDYFSFNANIHQHSFNANTRQSNRGNLFLTHRNSFRYGLNSIRYMGKTRGMTYQ